MVWNAMLDKTHRCGKKDIKTFLSFNPTCMARDECFIHCLHVHQHRKTRKTRILHLCPLTSNIKKHEFPRIFQKLWYRYRCVKLQGHLLPIFIPFFSTPSGVFMKRCVSKLSFSTTLFIPFISFYPAKRFFILFFSSHTTSYIPYTICTDLWNLYRFVRFDFRFARRPMVLPDRAHFYSRLRRRIFLVASREIFQIYSNLSNLVVWNDLYDLYRFVRFLPDRAPFFSRLRRRFILSLREKFYKSIQIFQIYSNLSNLYPIWLILN